LSNFGAKYYFVLLLFSTLAAADVQTAGAELDLVPLKITKLAGSQTMPKAIRIMVESR
jgi:hypothetical protein